MPEIKKPHLHEGHLHEEDVIQQLMASGYQVTDRQKEIEIVHGNDIVRGHVDGRVSVISIKPGVLEVKAPGKAEFKKMLSMGVKEWVKSKQEYAWQVSGAMLATDSDALVVVKSRDSGVIEQEWIKQPFYDLDDFKARLDELNDWVPKTSWPKCDHTGWCYNGPFRHVHYPEVPSKEPVPFTVVKEQTINTLAERLYDVRLKKAAVLQQEEDLKEELSQELTVPGMYETDRLVVRIGRDQQNTNIDTKAVRADHGDKYDKKGKVYRKIDVEPKG